jgi:aspartyl-tRNA(Asn)/glutamyl-tRNA(Gln) amidotransferase subunit C
LLSWRFDFHSTQIAHFGTMAITRDDVQHVAQLARLSFSDEEEERMAEEMSQILDHFEKLDELDTSGVPPMSHVLDVTNVFRADEIEERIDQEQALEPAPETDGGYFQVPKVVG